MNQDQHGAVAERSRAVLCSQPMAAPAKHSWVGTALNSCLQCVSLCVLFALQHTSHAVSGPWGTMEVIKYEEQWAGGVQACKEQSSSWATGTALR